MARRIAHEREARGMSYEGLAVQMKHHGCPISSSALFRIEKGEPPRRITVEELLAFSRVFAKPVENLLLPPEVAAREALVDLLVEWELAQAKADEARERETTAWTAIREYLVAHPDVEPALEDALAGWAEHYYDEADRVAAVAERMFAFTGSEE